jgi:AcrR family transcriptional regulator
MNGRSITITPGRDFRPGAGPKSARTRRRGQPEGVRSSRRASPKRVNGGRALVTFEKLVKAAGELLAEVGFEKLTSNGICARAKVTPPAFYHYFSNKYDILEELAETLLKKQSDAFAIWLFQNAGRSGCAAQIDALELWFRTAADIVAKEPGGIWTMRALRALPNLAHIRLQSQRLFTDQMFEFARRMTPGTPAKTLWYRLRIAAEFSFVVDELALEEDQIPRDIVFQEAARLMHGIIEEIRG